mgnify:CR=1 FL=1
MADWYNSNVSMLDYLPSCLNENEIFVQLSKGVDKGIKDLKKYAAEAVKNCCIATADEKIIGRYENIFGLSSKGLSLEYRRERIKSRLRQKPPVNEAALKKMMTGVFGKITKVMQGEEDYSVIVKYSEKTGYEDFDYAKDLLRKIVPANLLLEIVYAYVEWQSVRIYDWDDVKKYTWKELMSREITE